MNDSPEREEEQTSGADAVTTDSGIPVAVFYGPDPQGPDGEKELSRPGVFPYTRGIHETMYRGRLWTMRQYAGFGTAKDTNRRYHYLLDRGQKRA